MAQFGKKRKKKKEKSIDNRSNVKLKLIKNHTKPIKSSVHLCTLSTFPMYNQCNIIQWCKFYFPPKLCVHVGVLSMFLIIWLRKLWMIYGQNFSPNIIIGENIRIFIWELNKVYDMGIQFLGDKENKIVIHNRLKLFTNASLVHPCTLNIFLLYNQCNTFVQLV